VFDERHAEARKKLAASGERVATDMLAAEGAKLRAIMTGKDASVEAVEVGRPDDRVSGAPHVVAAHLVGDDAQKAQALGH
jgi:hypothetical protein